MDEQDQGVGVDAGDLSLSIQGTRCCQRRWADSGRPVCMPVCVCARMCVCLGGVEGSILCLSHV